MLHLWLPDDYEESNERYPVMYFFDGHNLFYNEDATYGKSWGLKEDKSISTTCKETAGVCRLH